MEYNNFATPAPLYMLPNCIEDFGTRPNRVLLPKNVMRSINLGCVSLLSSVTHDQMFMMLVVSEIQASAQKTTALDRRLQRSELDTDSEERRFRRPPLPRFKRPTNLFDESGSGKPT